VIYLLLISSVALCVAGTFVLVGNGNKVLANVPTKAEQHIVGGTLILVGAITAINCYLVLLTDNPRWLIDKVFEMFS